MNIQIEAMEQLTGNLIIDSEGETFIKIVTSGGEPYWYMLDYNKTNLILADSMDDILNESLAKYKGGI
jgi:hypothetical protein